MNNVITAQETGEMPYLLTNQFGKAYYDIPAIIRAYRLGPGVHMDNTVLVLLTENQRLDLLESYPGLGVHPYQTKSYFE